MKKFRNVPAIITLFAGFVVSVVMIKSRYELMDFLWTLVLVMVSFYIVGLGVSLLLNLIFKEKENKEDEEEKEGEEGETADKEKQEKTEKKK